MYLDSDGYAPIWNQILAGVVIAASVIVVALVVTAVVLTGPAGLAAIGYAAQGIALTGMSTSATIVTFAAAGSAGALASAVIYAAMSSKDIEEFNDLGPTALAMTATAGILGGYVGYLNRPVTTHYFPNNPDNFNPHGLTRHDYADGDIIKWQESNIDGTRGKAVFEWNYDAGPNGSHYHITPNGVNRLVHPFTGNTHMYPDDMIPFDFWGYFN